MKKTFYILVIGILLPILNACDYLDVVPDNIATIDHVFRDRITAETYLFTCYSFLPDHNNTMSNPGVSLSDEYANGMPGTNTIQRTLTETGNNPTNPSINMWDGTNGGKSMFAGIRCCNTFLEQIDNIPDISEAEALRWKAEAKFLKAYYHWVLFQLYGPVPIVDVNLPIDASVEQMRVFREPVDKVVDYIVKTIDESLTDLPNDVQGREIDELGRITKPAALAIKARILVTAASPLFNGNNDYSAFKDKRGINLFPTGETNQTKWQRAADACKAAIDACETAGLGLYVFVKPQASLVMDDSVRLAVQTAMILGETTLNNEVIWLQSNKRGSQNNTIPTKLFFGTSGAATTFVSPNEVFSQESASLNAAELFYSNNGVPIEEDKVYPYDNRYKPDPDFMTRTDHRFWIKEKYQTAILNLYREPRYYGSLAFDGANWYGFGISDQNSQFFVKAFNAQLGRQSLSCLYIKKLVPYRVSLATGQIANTNPGITYHPYSFPIIRMADLYLLYAEALNELTVAGAEPSNVIFEYVDKVRLRSGLKGVKESWTNHSMFPEKFKNKAGMREIIQRERMIEMAFEGIGGLDRRRWKMMNKLLSKNSIRGFTYNATTPEIFATPLVLWTTNFQFRDYLWPIRTSNLQINPNLVQNPGW